MGEATTGRIIWVTPADDGWTVEHADGFVEDFATRNDALLAAQEAARRTGYAVVLDQPGVLAHPS